MHKPRSAQGAWRDVEPNERLRLSGSRGKMMKVFVQLPVQFSNSPIPFNFGACQISLFEVPVGQQEWAPIETGQPFEIISTDRSGLSVTFAIRLLQQQIPLMFTARLPTFDNSAELFGYSVPFGTHNSGAPKVRPEKPAATSTGARQRVDSTSTREQHSSSPTSNTPSSPGSPVQYPNAWTSIQGNLYVDGVVRAQQCSLLQLSHLFYFLTFLICSL